MEKHQKHADIARPSYGQFARNEWAIIGTPCGNIQHLVKGLTGILSKKWKIAYVDAEHKETESYDGYAPGAVMEYTDKVNFHRFDRFDKLDNFQYRSLFNHTDAVIVNGNHFTASKQIVVIDKKKEESLSRKLDRLTNVQLILLADGMTAPFDFLQTHIQDIGNLPVLALDNVEGIASFLAAEWKKAIPPLHGLVLSGGKSVRMGQDKGAIDYYGMPQREYVAGMLSRFCEQTYLSCRPDQIAELQGPWPLLPDTFTGLGPMGAILSALRAKPDAAWLVVACDLPLLDIFSLSYLVEKRNASETATAFRSPVNSFPEPLVAIWEPRSYPVLLRFLAQGYSCPRKALINSPVHLLDAPDPGALKNINTPDELEEVMDWIKGQKS